MDMDSSLSNITSRRGGTGSAKKIKQEPSSHHTVIFTSFKDRQARSQAEALGAVYGHNTDEPRRIPTPPPLPIDTIQRQSTPSIVTKTAAVLSGVFLAVTLPLSVGFCLRTVQEYERAVVFRSGRIKAVHGPGTYLMLPFTDKCMVVDMRTSSSQISSLEATTADSVQLIVDGVVYYRVFDPLLAVTMSNNYRETTAQLAAEVIVTAFGKKSLQQVILTCASNGSDLLFSLDVITLPYGVRVVSLNLRTTKDSTTLKRLSDESSKKRNSNTQTEIADVSREIEPSRNPQSILLRYGSKRRSTVLFTLPEDFFSPDEVPPNKTSSASHPSEVSGPLGARDEDDPSLVSPQQLEDVGRTLPTGKDLPVERNSARKTNESPKALLGESSPIKDSSELTQTETISEHFLSDPLHLTTNSHHDRSSQFREHPAPGRSSSRELRDTAENSVEAYSKEPTRTEQISSSDENHISVPLDLTADSQSLQLQHPLRPTNSADPLAISKASEPLVLPNVVKPVKPQLREDSTQTDFVAKKQRKRATASASKPRSPSSDLIDRGEKR